MITFIFTSILLSAIAWAIYFFLVRKKTTPRRQKGFIYFSLAGSLLLPLTVSQHTPSFLSPNRAVKPLAFGQQIEPSHLKQYCRCENPNYAHRIRYRANAGYNFLFDYKEWVSGIIFASVGFLILHFIMQVFFLRYLVKTSEKKPVELEGMTFFLLSTQKRLGVGAFRLKNKFIIWQPDMQHLSTEELSAVFRHELSHLRQWNTLEKTILKVIQCFWFVNPVFYFFRRELDFLSECIADEAGAKALPHPREYARLLLKLKSQQYLPIVQHFRGNSLRRRIEVLLGSSSVQTRFSFFPGLLILFFLQGIFVQPLSARISRTLYELETYEEIYHKVVPGQTSAVYCTDCETVCVPDLTE
ncbi:MAG: M56 family metallopeptidase [Bacteroidia bacterium]|nr:M56 family metallopeptidase [Bacteroidia bacterium]